MVVRPWSHIVFKVVIMATTMCSGVTVVRYNLFWANKGQRERDIRKDPKDLDLAA